MLLPIKCLESDYVNTLFPIFPELVQYLLVLRLKSMLIHDEQKMFGVLGKCMAVSKTWKMFAFEMLISCKSFFTHLENKVYAFKMIPIEFFFQYHDRWNGSQCIPRLWMMNYVSGPKMKEKLLSMDFSNVHAVFLDFQYFFHPENRKPTIQQCKDLYSLTDMESDVPNSNKVCFEDAWVTTMLFVLNKSPDLLDDLIDFSCEKPSVKRILNRICTFKYRRNHSIANQ